MAWMKRKLLITFTLIAIFAFFLSFEESAELQPLSNQRLAKGDGDDVFAALDSEKISNRFPASSSSPQQNRRRRSSSKQQQQQKDPAAFRGAIFESYSDDMCDPRGMFAEKVAYELWHPPAADGQSPRSVVEDIIRPSREVIASAVPPPLIKAWADAASLLQNKTEKAQQEPTDHGTPLLQKELSRRCRDFSSRGAVLSFAVGYDLHAFFHFVSGFYHYSDPCTTLHIITDRPKVLQRALAAMGFVLELRNEHIVTTPYIVVEDYVTYKQLLESDTLFASFQSRLGKGFSKRPEVIRVPLTRLWVERHIALYHYFLLTDARDVLIFADPIMPMKDIAANLTARTDKEFFFAIHEEYPYEKGFYADINRGWVYDLANAATSEMLEQQVRLRGKTQFVPCINSGVYGGTMVGVNDFLIAFIATLGQARTAKMFGTDQGALLLLMYLGLPFVKYPHSVFLLSSSIGRYRHMYRFERGDLSAKIDAQGRHHNCRGEVYSIVHQFNRFAGWFRALAKIPRSAIRDLGHSASSTCSALSINSFVEPISTRPLRQEMLVPNATPLFLPHRVPSHKYNRFQSLCAGLLASSVARISGNDDGNHTSGPTQETSHNPQEKPGRGFRGVLLVDVPLDSLKATDSQLSSSPTGFAAFRAFIFSFFRFAVEGDKLVLFLSPGIDRFTGHQLAAKVVNEAKTKIQGFFGSSKKRLPQIQIVIPAESKEMRLNAFEVQARWLRQNLKNMVQTEPVAVLRVSIYASLFMSSPFDNDVVQESMKNGSLFFVRESSLLLMHDSIGGETLRSLANVLGNGSVLSEIPNMMAQSNLSQGVFPVPVLSSIFGGSALAVANYLALASKVVNTISNDAEKDSRGGLHTAMANGLLHLLRFPYSVVVVDDTQGAYRGAYRSIASGVVPVRRNEGSDESWTHLNCVGLPYSFVSHLNAFPVEYSNCLSSVTQSQTGAPTSDAMNS